MERRAPARRRGGGVDAGIVSGGDVLEHVGPLLLLLVFLQASPAARLWSDDA